MILNFRGKQNAHRKLPDGRNKNAANNIFIEQNITKLKQCLYPTSFPKHLLSGYNQALHSLS